MVLGTIMWLERLEFYGTQQFNPVLEICLQFYSELYLVSRFQPEAYLLA